MPNAADLPNYAFRPAHRLHRHPRQQPVRVAEDRLQRAQEGRTGQTREQGSVHRMSVDGTRPIVRKAADAGAAGTDTAERLPTGTIAIDASAPRPRGGPSIASSVMTHPRQRSPAERWAGTGPGTRDQTVGAGRPSRRRRCRGQGPRGPVRLLQLHDPAHRLRLLHRPGGDLLGTGRAARPPVRQGRVLGSSTLALAYELGLTDLVTSRRSRRARRGRATCTRS